MKPKLPTFYLIHAPNSNLWWKADRRGYTNNLARAGVYSEEEAKGIEGLGRGDTAVLLASMLEEIVRTRNDYREDITNLTMMLRKLCNLKGKNY